jgi:hypothetical protein
LTRPPGSDSDILTPLYNDFVSADPAFFPDSEFAVPNSVFVSKRTKKDKLKRTVGFQVPGIS